MAEVGQQGWRAEEVEVVGSSDRGAEGEQEMRRVEMQSRVLPQQECPGAGVHWVEAGGPRLGQSLSQVLSQAQL